MSHLCLCKNPPILEQFSAMNEQLLSISVIILKWELPFFERVLSKLGLPENVKIDLDVRSASFVKVILISSVSQIGKTSLFLSFLKRVTTDIYRRSLCGYTSCLECPQFLETEGCFATKFTCSTNYRKSC